MAEESRSQLREFQLETRHLAAIVVLIALLCISSFLLGRWVERQAYRATSEVGALRAGSPGGVSVEDVNRELTYFRTLEEDQPPPAVHAAAPAEKPAPVRVEAKPIEEAGPSPASGETDPSIAKPGTSAAPQPSAKGSVLIQVMATKDRAAAVALRNRLAAKGYPVSIAEGSAGPEAGLRRVRVGPYPGRAEAEKIARKLKSEEGLRTWIP
jgi:cell division protein FtsN